VSVSVVIKNIIITFLLY